MKNNTNSTANSQDQTTLELNHKTNNNIGDNTNLVEDQVKTPNNNKTQIITNGETMQTAKNQIEQDTLTSFDETKEKYEIFLKSFNKIKNSEDKISGSVKINDKDFTELENLLTKETALVDELNELSKMIEKIQEEGTTSIINQGTIIKNRIRILAIEKELNKIQLKRAKVEEKMNSIYNNMTAKVELNTKKKDISNDLSKKAMKNKEVICNFITMKIKSNENWKKELIETLKSRLEFRSLTLKRVKDIIQDSRLQKVINTNSNLQTIIVNDVYNTLATIQ